MKHFKYHGIVPQQSGSHTVFCFCAKASDILKFARIDRIGRSESGHLSGFQRPQVAGHIQEIRSYLKEDNAVLPNSIVVAFTSGVTIAESQQPGTAATSTRIPIE